MEPHQQRVIDEEKELRERLGKLNAFIDGSQFGAVPEAEQDRLLRQSYYMRGYLVVLQARITAFPV